MAVAHRASAVTGGNLTTGYTLTIPASTQTGDLLYISITSRDSTAGSANVTCTDNDSGGNTWAVLTNSSDKKAWIFWKRATSATASKTITVGACVGSASGCVSVYSGGDGSATPHSNSSIESNASADETHAGFTPSQADSMIVLSVHNTGNDNSISSPAVATNPGALAINGNGLSTGGSDCGAAQASNPQVGAAAATGNFTWAQTDGTTISIVWAIKPLAATTISGGVASATGVAASGTLTIAGLALTGGTPNASSVAAAGSLTIAGITLSGAVAEAGGVAAAGQITEQEPEQEISGAVAAATGVADAGALAIAGVSASGGLAQASGVADAGALTLGGVAASGAIAHATGTVDAGSLTLGGVTASGAIASAAGVAGAGALTLGALDVSGGVAAAAGVAIAGSLTVGAVVLNGAIAGASGATAAGQLVIASLTIDGATAAALGVASPGALAIAALAIAGVAANASGVAATGQLIVEGGPTTISGDVVQASGVALAGALSVAGLTLVSSASAASGAATTGELTLTFEPVTLIGAPAFATGAVSAGIIDVGGTVVISGDVALAIGVAMPGVLTALGLIRLRSAGTWGGARFRVPVDDVSRWTVPIPRVTMSRTLYLDNDYLAFVGPITGINPETGAVETFDGTDVIAFITTTPGGTVAIDALSMIPVRITSGEHVNQYPVAFSAATLSAALDAYADGAILHRVVQGPAGFRVTDPVVVRHVRRSSP